MLKGNSSLLQVYQLYLREIKEKEHKNWAYNAQKFHNKLLADRKSHNYAVHELIKAVGLDDTPSAFKLMSLIINEKFSIRKMSILKIDTAIFVLENNKTL